MRYLKTVSRRFKNGFRCVHSGSSRVLYLTFRTGRTPLPSSGPRRQHRRHNRHTPTPLLVAAPSHTYMSCPLYTPRSEAVSIAFSPCAKYMSYAHMHAWNNRPSAWRSVETVRSSVDLFACCTSLYFVMQSLNYSRPPSSSGLSVLSGNFVLLTRGCIAWVPKTIRRKPCDAALRCVRPPTTHAQRCIRSYSLNVAGVTVLL